MGAVAWTFGGIAGLCLVMGIATVVIPLLSADFTWMFWFMLSGVLFLASIAFAVGRSEE